MQYRPHASGRAFERLLRLDSCWHLDAWLYRDRVTRSYVLYAEERRGGRVMLGSYAYQLAPGADPILYSDTRPLDVDAVTLNDREIAPDRAWLETALDAAGVTTWGRDGYRARSVCLHYVRAPSLDPMAGLENFFVR